MYSLTDKASRTLFRWGILAGQIYDTRRPIQPTTLVCLDGRLEKLPGAPGIKEGDAQDWCAARLAARAWNWGRERSPVWHAMQDGTVCDPCRAMDGMATSAVPPHPECEEESGECRCVVKWVQRERWIVKAAWFGRR